MLALRHARSEPLRLSTALRSRPLNRMRTHVWTALPEAAAVRNDFACRPRAGWSGCGGLPLPEPAALPSGRVHGQHPSSRFPLRPQAAAPLYSTRPSWPGGSHRPNRIERACGSTGLARRPGEHRRRRFDGGDRGDGPSRGHRPAGSYGAARSHRAARSHGIARCSWAAWCNGTSRSDGPSRLERAV